MCVRTYNIYMRACVCVTVSKCFRVTHVNRKKGKNVRYEDCHEKIFGLRTRIILMRIRLAYRIVTYVFE